MNEYTISIGSRDKGAVFTKTMTVEADLILTIVENLPSLLRDSEHSIVMLDHLTINIDLKS